MHLFWFKSHLSFLPDDCVSFSVSTMWAGRNSFCSVPLHTGIKGDVSAECSVMKQEPLVRARGESTIIGDCPNGKDGITGHRSFSSRNFSLPKKQERSQQRWLSQRSGWRAVWDTVNVQKRLGRLAELGLHLWLCEPAQTVHHLESAKNRDCHLPVAVDTDHQIPCLDPLAHSCIPQMCMELHRHARPPARRWGSVGD